MFTIRLLSTGNRLGIYSNDFYDEIGIAVGGDYPNNQIMLTISLQLQNGGKQQIQLLEKWRL